MVIVNNKEQMMNRAPIYSDTWTGQDGRLYRTVRFWVGTGWTAGFLQYQDDLLNWVGY